MSYAKEAVLRLKLARDKRQLRVDELVRLYKSGMTLRSIADLKQISSERVRSLMDVTGFTKLHRKRVQEARKVTKS